MPVGSGRVLLGINLDIISFQSIAFLPSMPAVHLSLLHVPAWARWWIPLMRQLKVVLGNFTAMLALIDIEIPELLEPACMAANVAQSVLCEVSGRRRSQLRRVPVVDAAPRQD